MNGIWLMILVNRKRVRREKKELKVNLIIKINNFKNFMNKKLKVNHLNKMEINHLISLIMGGKEIINLSQSFKIRNLRKYTEYN
jgi:hypothetical protein